MLNLLDKMFIKRFCLPVDSDIELYEQGKKGINECLCGHYNHAACILQRDGGFEKSRILSYGFNKMGDSDGLKAGVHAEYDAIRKLQPLDKKKKPKHIIILVIRISGKNKLQSSKPCANCINIMKTLPLRLGYKITNVYYSNSDGNILKSTIQYLEEEEYHYSRFYRQRMKKNRQ
jgi:hypothetical protein